MKRFLILLLAVVSICILSGCQHISWFDTSHQYTDRAAIKLNDGTVVQGEVEPWGYFDDSDQLQVRIQIDGVDYLIRFENPNLEG